MGGTVPADSVATGKVTIVEGSTTETGTIRILTRGLNQTVESIGTAQGSRAEVFSQGRASHKEGGVEKPASLELAASSQSPCFPLIIIAAALDNPEWSFEYLGLEEFDGQKVHHVRFWNSFASQPKLRQLAEFTTREIWIDARSFLPQRLAYERREAGGEADRIPTEISFADYRDVGGVLYPFRIERSLNGTPWTSINIQTVSLNTNLSEAAFPIR
jgi:hypothetical protein